MIAVEFGSRTIANDVRDLDGVRPHLSRGDDRRTKTIMLKGDTPERIVERVRGEAADSRRIEAQAAGQVPLTRKERKRIDFSREGVNVLKARAIKGIAQAEGVEDWIAFADLDLTVDENREVLRGASHEERGRRGLGRSQEKTDIERRARGRAAQKQDVDRAVEFGILEADEEAQEFVREEESFGADPFDLAFSSSDEYGRPIPTGRTAELVEEVHAERSARARGIDEREAAPLADSPEEWAANPDELDLPGVDEPTPAGDVLDRFADAEEAVLEGILEGADEYGPTSDTPVPEEDRGVVGGRDRHPGVGLIPDEHLGELEGTGLAPSDFEVGLGLEREEHIENRVEYSGNPFGLAAGEEADLAFLEAERERAGRDVLEVEETGQAGLGGELVEADPQASFALDVDVREAQGRESRLDEAAASEFGVDDRALDPSSKDSGEEGSLEIFGGGVRENEELF